MKSIAGSLVLGSDPLPGSLERSDGQIICSSSNEILCQAHCICAGQVITSVHYLQVATRPLQVWSVPDGWSLAEAATVPVAYCTAYLALCVRGRLQPDHRVLIHSGSGAVGMAALRICLHRGCEVCASGLDLGEACHCVDVWLAGVCGVS